MVGLLVVVGALMVYGADGADVGGHRTVDIARSYGYDVEERQVVTADGYILCVTHIKSVSTKLPVLMIHGVLAASDIWLQRGPGKDLALLLVDEGHDVWLADLRGNYYSHNHTSLDTSQPEFWDFSIQEIALYDLPILIETILADSGSKQLQYIGHSMGTTVYFVLCSSRPQYNKAFHTAIHLSPIVFPKKTPFQGLFRLALHNRKKLEEVMLRRRAYEVVPRTVNNQEYINYLCSDTNIRLCLYVYDQLYGKEVQLTNVTKLRQYLKIMASGSSLKTFMNLGQIITSNESSLRMFDYGKTRNYQVYKSTTAPAYPVHKVTSPVALFYPEYDIFIDKFSFNKLVKTLPNVVSTFFIPKYNHIDVLFADSTTQLVYKHVIKLLSNS